MSTSPRVIYDGSAHCSPCCDACPVAVFDEDSNTVTIADPAKPENGSFVLTRDEWNTLLTYAQKI